MTCEFFKTADGCTGIVCSRGKRREVQRCWCGAVAMLLCDYPAARRKLGTCDRPLCRQHAREVGPDRHYCLDHRQEVLL